MAFYRLDSSKLTSQEQRRLQLGTQTSETVLELNSFQAVKPSDFPVHVYKAFVPKLEAIQELGFELIVVYKQPSGTEVYAATFLSPSRETALSLNFEDGGVVTTTFGTLLQSGEEMLDIDGEQTYDKPPDKLAKYHPGVQLEQLWATHQQRIQGQPTVARVSDDAALLQLINQDNRDWIDFAVDRGVLVPLEVPTSESAAEELGPAEFWTYPGNKSQLPTQDNRQLRPAFGMRKDEGIWLKMLAACSLVFLLCTLKYSADWYHLEHHAANTSGQVTDLKRTKNKSSYSHYVYYDYQVAGIGYHGSEHISERYYRNLKRGQTIAIVYDVDTPAHSLVKGQESLLDYVPSLIPAVMMSLLFGGLLLLVLSQERALARLLAGGQLVEGVILSASERTSKQRFLDLEYELQTASGVFHNTQSIRSHEPVPEPGSKCKALYLDAKHVGLL